MTDVLSSPGGTRLGLYLNTGEMFPSSSKPQAWLLRGGRASMYNMHCLHFPASSECLGADAAHWSRYIYPGRACGVPGLPALAFCPCLEVRCTLAPELPLLLTSRACRDLLLQGRAPACLVFSHEQPTLLELLPWFQNAFFFPLLDEAGLVFHRNVGCLRPRGAHLFRDAETMECYLVPTLSLGAHLTNRCSFLRGIHPHLWRLENLPLGACPSSSCTLQGKGGSWIMGSACSLTPAAEAIT